MAWENPVTTWGQAGKTVPGAGDFNRIEGNIQHLQDTKETPAGAQAKAEAEAGAVRAELNAHVADNAANPRGNQIYHVEVISSSVSETPDAGRIIFDTSQGKFFGGNGTEWV